MITILDDFPIILTKDKDWKPKAKAVSGAFIYLPEDAILVMPRPTEGDTK